MSRRKPFYIFCNKTFRTAYKFGRRSQNLSSAYTTRVGPPFLAASFVAGWERGTRAIGSAIQTDRALRVLVQPGTELRNIKRHQLFPRYSVKWEEIQGDLMNNRFCYIVCIYVIYCLKLSAFQYTNTDNTVHLSKPLPA
jgi:hypothetical protein